MRLVVEFGAQMLVKCGSAGPAAHSLVLRALRTLTLQCFEAVQTANADPGKW